jgi:hypothetical protein
MTRKLGPILMVLTLAVCASAAVNPGTISGFVKNSAGVPQMGAAVEVLASAASQTIYTDTRGFFSTSGLLPGNYVVKVSAPSFLPTVRENIRLDSGATLIVNLTLNTLFEAVQMLPTRARTPEEHDDWKWTLRSNSNRPILRVLDDDGPLVVVSKSEDEKDNVLKARVAFLAGSDGSGFGSTPDMSTNFEVEQSLFSSGTLSFNGDIGYGSGLPAGIVRAAYSREMPDGSKPEIALTARRFATIDSAPHSAALQALALSLADSTQIGDFLGINYGGEFQTVQFMGTSNAFRPFGSADLHLTHDLVLGYRFASSRPTTRRYKGFDSSPADLSETDPRVALVGDDPRIERANHQEMSIALRRGANRFQAAYYRDRIRNTVINGVGDPASGGDFLSDVYSGTFNYSGGDLSANGMRLVYERSLSATMTATLDYAFGGALVLDQPGLNWDQLQGGIKTQNHHSLAAKFAGTVPGTRTRVISSYRWTDEDVLTPVDMFNASAGQTDPYLNIFFRQPLGRRLIPANVEALVDVRNLLAQGYMPFMGQDGHTLYLVQAARSIRGGLSFTF